MDEFLLQLKDDHREFEKGKLEDLLKDTDPMLLFQKWYKDAFEKQCAEPHTMVISTVSDNKPSSRIVYMKEILEEGLIFYTNYESRKSKELETNPHIAALFYWDCIERQVRVEGEVEKTPDGISDAYFQSRPRKSQLSAWASKQSSKIKSREELEKAFQETEKRFEGEKNIPRPPFWGGFLIKPARFEFWQGRPGRLHDRICFEKKDDKQWNIFRINP